MCVNLGRSLKHSGLHFPSASNEGDGLDQGPLGEGEEKHQGGGEGDFDSHLT